MNILPKHTKRLAEMRRSGKLSDYLSKYGYYPCATNVAVGSCENGHNYGKQIVCGREWCEYCGEKGSSTHLRRVSRWLPKINQMGMVGYLVVTVPGECRERIMQPGKLADYRRALIRYLKREGYERGLCRLHWVGDCEQCSGKGCEYCDYKGTGKRFHPHFNFIFENGFISRQKLTEIKEFAGKWCKNNLGFTGSQVVVNYQFTNEPGKKVHILNYVTRATLRFSGISVKKTQNFNSVNIDTAIQKEAKKQFSDVIENTEKQYVKLYVVDIAKGFRNSIVWGKFDKVNPENLSTKNDTDLLNNSICPCCAEKTGEFQQIKYLKAPIHIKDIGSDRKFKDGFYYFVPGNLEKFISFQSGNLPDIEQIYREKLKNNIISQSKLWGGGVGFELLIKHGFLPGWKKRKIKGKNFYIAPQ